MAASTGYTGCKTTFTHTNQSVRMSHRRGFEGDDLGKKRGLSDVIAAALIAAAANAPIAAYVAYTHHKEEMARISGEAEKRISDANNVRQTKIIELYQSRCAVALQFLGDERINPSLKPDQTQVLLTDMRQVAHNSCNFALQDGRDATQMSPRVTKELRQ